MHALAEVFSTLTGGAQGLRIGAGLAQRLLRESVLPYVQGVTLQRQGDPRVESVRARC